ncbi:hypothetical protein FRC11_005255, partial [Ceratobasidium sp. 423]
SYHCRFKQRKVPSDLDDAIEYVTLALSHAPEGHPGVYRLLIFLGICHHQRFHLMNQIRDLDTDIAYKTRAILIEPDSTDPSVIIGLGRAYQTRFQRLGDLDDLEKSIEYCTRAVSVTANNDQSLPDRLDSLGNAYLLRFQRLDDPGELDKGIEHQTRAASLTPQDHHGFAGRLNNLAASFNMRYNRLGDSNDLEKSMEYSIHALSLTTPKDRSLEVRVLVNLSILQLLRFQHLKDPDDLEKGIEYNARAFSLTAGNHPDEALRLKHLGELYYARFDLLRDASDLDLAIESVSHAVLLLPDGDEDLGDQLDHLGGYIHARWHLLHNPDDLDQDIEHKYRAVVLTPEYHSRRSRRIESLGRSYLCKSLSDHPCDHQQMLRLALDCFRQASLAESNLPLMKFKSACIWARSSLKLSLAESLEAYQVAIDLIPQVIWLGSTVVQRYHDAKELSNLAGEAASVAIKARDYKRALEWLEQGQSVVMNQNMMLRSPLDRLRSIKPALAESLQKVATELQAVASRDQIHYDMVLSNVSLNSPDKMADIHHQLAKEHANLLSRPNQCLEELPRITWCTIGALSFLPFHAAGIYGDSRTCISDYAISSYTPSLTTLLSSSPPAMATSILAISQEKTPGSHSSLPGAVQELEYIREHADGVITYTQVTNEQATVEAVLDAMEYHDCVHLACHAHQGVGDPTKSGFFLHDGTLNLISIMRRSFDNKGLAFLSACQTAMGDKNLPNETVHLASSMLTAGYPSVIATMWSVWDKDAPLVADKVYGQLLKDGEMDCRDSAKALHYAIWALRREIGDEKFLRWVPFIHIGS